MYVGDQDPESPPADQHDRIDPVARAHGLTMVEVVRTAVDRYPDESPDPAGALAATFEVDRTASAVARRVGSWLRSSSTWT
jgi:hypothetical protein